MAWTLTTLTNRLTDAHRGREGVTLPALRTVRAVFPHTALQSVVSSSGVSRVLPGRVKREQPGIGEEGVGPEAMVIASCSESGPMGLPAQDRPQPSADELVEHDERAGMRVLEVSDTVRLVPLLPACASPRVHRARQVHPQTAAGGPAQAGPSARIRSNLR